MHRFHDVLFSPLGRTGNPAALRQLARVLDPAHASLTLLGVGAGPSRLQRLLHRPGLVDEVAAGERATLERDVSRWARNLGDGFDVTTEVELGDPARSIIERVLARHHDLVVVTSDEDDDDRATIRRLLRHCPCPVWVIRPTRAKVTRVLAAVNPDPDEIDLNRTILELAASVVDACGGEFHVAHAWELYGETAMRSSAFIHMTDSEVDQLLIEERAKHRRAVETLLADTSGDRADVTLHVVHGPAHEEIPALARQQRINLLVMGTVARTGVTALVMGNTAERVLDDVECSVLAVKPAGFHARG